MVTGPDIEPMRFKSRLEAKDGADGIIREYRSLRSVGTGPERMVEGSMGRPRKVE